MKECWYKAMEGRKPDRSVCIPQMMRGACERCRYYREDEYTENEMAVEVEENA